MKKKVQAIPTISNVRAIITTKWGKSGYRPHTVASVESYYVDTALDTDADVWSINVGDPEGEMMEMLHRDNEVRVKLFGYSPSGAEPIMTGIADTIEFTEEGVWTITGRDLSAIAVDCTVPPQFFSKAFAYSLIRQQALRLGFPKTNLATGLGGIKIVKKRVYTDGNESYWQFWYRLFRKEKLWLWTAPDGTLNGTTLNYEGAPFYYFGVPKRGDSAAIQNAHIPIEHVAFTKDVQRRVEQVWVYWHKGHSGQMEKAKDPHMRDWIRKPLKIITDTDARVVKSAQASAYEEIFEGKVGELEMKIVVPDPGYEIRQNKIARVRIPELGYANTMYVVGIRRAGGPDGVVLEIRLRERNYAITRRVPKDPVIHRNEPGKGQRAAIGDQLPLTVVGMPDGWADFFLASAVKWHGPWDFNLYLATLIGICTKETTFKNERAFGGPGGNHLYYPWKLQDGYNEFPNRPGPGEVPKKQNRDKEGRTRKEWEEIFANEPGEYTSETWAVGPMQLWSLGYKQYADNLLKQGWHDQYSGGRWTPEYNIMGGGYALRDKLAGLDPTQDDNIWKGVKAYGPSGTDEYWQAIYKFVLVDPGYLQMVKDARSQATAPGQPPVFDPGGDTKAPFYNSPADLKKLTWLDNSGGHDITHVNWTLLTRLNSLGRATGKKILITSGYRSKAEQAYLYDQYIHHGGNIAAPPGRSNHEKGEAIDCDVGGVPIMDAVPDFVLAKYKLHCSVKPPRSKTVDHPHVTRIEIWG